MLFRSDNEMSWLDWTNKKKYKEIYDFTRKTIELKRKHIVFRRKDFFNGKAHSPTAIPDITWFGTDGKELNWEKVDHFLAIHLSGNKLYSLEDIDDWDFYLLTNTSKKDVSAILPSAGRGKRWYRFIDTSVPARSEERRVGKECRSRWSPYH